MLIKIVATITLIGCFTFFVHSITSNTDLMAKIKKGTIRNKSTTRKTKKKSRRRSRKITIPKEAPAPKPDATGFALHGIIYSKTNPVALINNDSYSIGDTVNGAVGSATITEINEQSVTLSNSSSHIKLEL